MDLISKPLRIANWPDFEQLFGSNGACGGCWCMTLRLNSCEYEQLKGEGNRQALLSLVLNQEHVGVLAYDENEAVGWCAISPRNQFKRLKTSRIFKPLDDIRVWSIGCIFIKKKYRQKGLSVFLIDAAKNYGFSNGAEAVEAYPHDPIDHIPEVFAYSGLLSAYLKNGFKEVARNARKRPIVRCYPESINDQYN